MWAMCGRVSDGPLAGAGGGDGVEALADGPVADRVEVRLEPRGVEAASRQPGSRSGSMKLIPRFVVGVPSAPRYGSIIAPVYVSRTPSCISFTLFDPEPADGARPRPLDQLVDLLVAALAVPPHRGLDPGGQPARLGRGPVDRLVLGADDRVLPGRDPERVEVGLGEAQAVAHVLGGDRRGISRSTSVGAPSWSAPVGRAVGVALDPAVGRVRRVAIDPGQLEGLAC